MAVPVFAIIAAAAAAAGAIAKGTGEAKASKKLFQGDQSAELDRLQSRAKRGQAGLTDEERLEMEQQFLAAGSAAQRDQQQQRLQAATLQGQSSGVSARDVFLREQAAQSAALGARQEQNRLVQGIQQQEVAKDEARIQQLQAERNAADQARVQAITHAISGGIGGGGDFAAGQAAHRQNIEVAQAQQGTQTNTDVVNQYTAGQQTTGYDYTNRLGSYNTGSGTGSF